ncbi:MAG TPA: M48 family metalloprotease, partial [Baekduia sp.]|nr:M48 family metalloprotease [Baekduia sp.]
NFAHVHHRDIPYGLLYLLIVAPAGLFAASVVVRRLDRGGAHTVAVLALAIGLVATPVTWVSNQLSRRVEARADTYSLRLTGEPDAFLRFERRIAVRNISDPDPPGWRTFLFATHPPTVERLGIGEAFRDQASGSGG